LEPFTIYSFFELSSNRFLSSYWQFLWQFELGFSWIFLLLMILGRRVTYSYGIDPDKGFVNFLVALIQALFVDNIFTSILHVENNFFLCFVKFFLHKNRFVLSKEFFVAESGEDSLQAEINSSLQSSKKTSRVHSKLETELTDSDNEIPLMGSSTYR
jgi:hypothetical protein